jgi:hypothetical protein
MSTYAIKHVGDKHYELTKFNEDGDVLQQYDVVGVQCNCPQAAFRRKECKHLRMLDGWLQLLPEQRDNYLFDDSANKFILREGLQHGD